MLSELGTRIRLRHQQSNITLRELARRVGISPSAVSQIEQGRTQPTITTLYALAVELQVSLDELLDLDAQRREAVARQEFFAIMSAFPTGVAIVTTLEPDGTPRGLTTNAVTSVSAEPPILLVSVDLSSRTLPALRHSKRFVVNFMRDDCAEICALFASKAEDKFSTVAWTPGLGGVPILHEGAVAHAECATLQELEIGDHVVVTGLVEAGSAPEQNDVPIVYYRREYSSAPSPT